MNKFLSLLLISIWGILMIPGQELVILYKSPQAFKEAMELYDGAGKKVTPAYIQRTAALVPAGTKASIIESSFSKGLSKVLIVEGKFQGTIGWVPNEWYHSDK